MGIYNINKRRMAQHMASKFGRTTSLLQRGAFNASRSAAPANELTNNWLRRLSATSQTPHAREVHSQLQSVLDYYNIPDRKSGAAEIDWDGYRANIHTPGVVDKLQAKYDAFVETIYTVDSAVARCGGTTEKMQALDVAMKYNFQLYLTHYLGHLD